MLIGGSYHGQDQRDTPLGQTTGVEIQANVIGAELHGRVIEPPRWSILIALACVIDISLIILFYRLPFGRSLLFTVPVMALVALLFSILEAGAINSYAQWTYFGMCFAPLMLGFLLQQLLDRLGTLKKMSIKNTYDELAKGKYITC